MIKLTVFGNPIAHSQSPFIHHAFAKQMDLVVEYRKCLVPLGTLSNALTQFFQHSDGKGCNITVPFKEDAFSLVDRLDDTALHAKAVNTIKRNDDGQLIGYNTDGAGLVMDLKRLGHAISGQRILLLGAGGAARGALTPLLQHQPQQLYIHNRTYVKAEQLASEFSHPQLSAVSDDALNDLEVDIIINATSASISGAELPIPASVFRGCQLAYDMMYAEAPTPFMVQAKNSGAYNQADGLGMLVAQAAYAFEIWTGKMPSTENVILDLRAALATS